MEQRRTRVDLPQPLRVRLEAPPPPTLLSWEATLKRHRGLVLLGLLLMVAFLVSGVVAYLLAAPRAQVEVTLPQGACQAKARLEYPRFGAVGAPLHLRLTLQASSLCPFAARVVLTPHAEAPLEALTPPVWTVDLPSGGLTTLEATLVPVAPGDLVWQVFVPNQPTPALAASPDTRVWGRWADDLRRLAWALGSLSFLAPLSALLGLWPSLRAWLHRLRRP